MVETPGRKEEQRAISLKRKMPIIISGNNFDLMNMETGVTIKSLYIYNKGLMIIIIKIYHLLN